MSLVNDIISWRIWSRATVPAYPWAAAGLALVAGVSLWLATGGVL